LGVTFSENLAHTILRDVAFEINRRHNDDFRQNLLDMEQASGNVADGTGLELQLTLFTNE
jgi:hypothetical protein